MSEQIKTKPLQVRFLEAVKNLHLKFEVAEISKATGIGEPTVSIYLNSKREVSRPFLRRFCEVYNIDLDYIVTGKGEQVQAANENRFSADQLFAMFLEVSGKQSDILKSIESKMAQEKTQARIEKKVDDIASNLTETLTGVEWVSKMQLQEMLDLLSQLRDQKTVHASDSHKKSRGNGGDGHKSGIQP